MGVTDRLAVRSLAKNECVHARYLLIIFTNQGGINLKKADSGKINKASRLDDFKLKVEAVMAALDLPVTLYAATEDDKYRKPRIGMWEEMADDYDLDAHGVVKEQSFLIGDAAGRDGDHAASDRYSYPLLLIMNYQYLPLPEQCVNIVLS